MMIPAITLRNRIVVESEELDKYESGPLWVIDEDFKSGRELNFKRYDDLSGLYEIFLDGEFKHEDDIADAITAGAAMVTLSENVDRERIKKILFYTESLILYVNSNEGSADFFFDVGGQSIYSDSFVFQRATKQFSRVLSCDRCDRILPMEEFNARGNKETSSIP